MKQKIKLLPIILSLLLFISFFLNFTSVVYASDEYGGGGNTRPTASEKLSEVLGNVEKYSLFVLSQLGALNNGSFSQSLSNFQYFVDTWNDDNITYNEENDTITFSQDLVSAIKQALIEYSEETNGYTLVPTYRWSDYITPSGFTYLNEYQYFLDYARTHSYFAFARTNTTNNTHWYVDLSEEIPMNYSLVNNGLQDSSTGKYAVYLYDNELWEKGSFDISYTTFNEGEMTNENVIVSSYASYFVLGTANPGVVYKPTKSSYWYLFSNDGGRVKVYHNLTAFKNAQADYRTVYFGKDFYDSVPADMTVSLDDLEAFDTSNIEELLTELKNQMGENEATLSEDTIENLVQELLDEYFKRLEESGGTSGGTADKGFFDTWLEKIYAKLEDIEKVLKKIKNWTAIDTVIDGVDAVADWFSLIHDLLADADNGAESAVSTVSSALSDGMSLLKSKFPFSIPWDLFFLVSLLEAEPEAPIFKLPIVLDRFGISEAIEIDMSMFETMSSISRSLLAVLYAYGLINMTPKIISIGKES